MVTARLAKDPFDSSDPAAKLFFRGHEHPKLRCTPLKELTAELLEPIPDRLLVPHHQDDETIKGRTLGQREVRETIVRPPYALFSSAYSSQFNRELNKQGKVAKSVNRGRELSRLDAHREVSQELNLMLDQSGGGTEFRRLVREAKERAGEPVDYNSLILWKLASALGAGKGSNLRTHELQDLMVMLTPYHDEEWKREMAGIRSWKEKHYRGAEDNGDVHTLLIRAILRLMKRAGLTPMGELHEGL